MKTILSRTGNAGFQRLLQRFDRPWFVFLVGLSVFLVFIKGLARLNLPEETLVLMPLGIAAASVFLIWPTVALVFWIVAVSVVPWPLVGGEIYLYDLLTVFLLGIWAIKILTRKQLRFEGPDWFIFGICASSFLSIWVNFDRIAEISDRYFRIKQVHLSFPGKLFVVGILVWGVYLLAYFLASRLADTKRRVAWGFAALLTAGTINAVYSLWNWYRSGLGFSRLNRQAGFLAEVTDQGYLSCFLLLGIVVVATQSWFKGKRRWLLFACGGVLLLNLVFNFSRSVYLMFAVGMGVLILLSRSKKLIVASVLVGILALGVFFGVGVEKRSMRILTDFYKARGSGLTLRMVSWLDAIRIFREEGGFWGVGMGNYQVFSEARYRQNPWATHRGAWAHSMHLQNLAEQGIPSTVAWGVFYIGMMVYCYRRIRRSPDPRTRALNMWIFAMMPAYIIDGIWYMALIPYPSVHRTLQVGYFVWIAIGLVVAWNRIEAGFYSSEQSLGVKLPKPGVRLIKQKR